MTTQEYICRHHNAEDVEGARHSEALCIKRRSFAGRVVNSDVPEERLPVRNLNEVAAVVGRRLSTEHQVYAAVGSSLHKDFAQAIASAGDKLEMKLGSSPSFLVAAMVLPISKGEKLEQADSVRAAECLKQRFPGIPCLGALSYGGIQAKSAHYPVVSLWGICDPGGIYIVSHSGKSGEEDVRTSALSSLGKVPPEAGGPQFVFAFAASGCEQAINGGIRSVVHSNVAIIGGTPFACSVTGRTDSWQISSRATTEDGVCAAFCWPSVKYDPLPLFPWFSLETKRTAHSAEVL